MGKVLVEITMSLDGYTTGPDVSAEEPFGRGGERLHDWMFAGKSAADIEAFMTGSFGGVGAVIMGRRMADLGIGPWGEEPVFRAPCFVVIHRPAETIVKTDLPGRRFRRPALTRTEPEHTERRRRT